MDTLAIIKRIDMRLAEIGMSKAEFYKKSGITSASYSQWNTGKFNPTPKKLRNAAECLGISYEYLLTGAEQLKITPTPVSESERSTEFAELMSQLTPDERKLIVSQIKGILSNRE